jgi:hypothetical protein
MIVASKVGGAWWAREKGMGMMGGVTLSLSLTTKKRKPPKILSIGQMKTYFRGV